MGSVVSISRALRTKLQPMQKDQLLGYFQKVVAEKEPPLIAKVIHSGLHTDELVLDDMGLRVHRFRRDVDGPLVYECWERTGPRTQSMSMAHIMLAMECEVPWSEEVLADFQFRRTV